MSLANVAEQTLKGGDPLAALTQLQEQVRAKPADFKLRIFLFQLLCVVGHWERALNQLNVASNLDPSAIGMAQMYGDAIRCEAIRVEVFDGKKSPMIFGEPDQWLALLIESLLVGGRGEPERSHELRARAFEEAPTTQGSIDGKPFEWIADADSRLGPVLEAVINGRYYWVPFSRLLKVDIEPPEDLRDMVWMPAHLQFENGGESVAFIPTRYPGSESSADGLIVLARKTVWEEIATDTFRGLGQRVITTDVDDIPLMDVRSIVLTPGGEDETPAAGDANG
jgi:type VI secretion system protein ImpE